MTSIKRRLILLLQLATGLGLVAFILLRVVDPERFVTAMQDTADRWPLLLAGASIPFVCLCLCALRWKLLIGAQGLEFSFLRSLALYLVGQFWNAFLFGTTGGDVVKSVYVAREAPGKRTEAVATVFIDRLVGLVALVSLAVIMMLCRLRFFLSTPEMKVALLLNVAALVGTGLAMLLVFRQDLFERLALFRRLEAQTGAGKVMARAYRAFLYCFEKRGLLVKTLLLSWGNHLTLIVCVYFFALALDCGLSPLDTLTIFPVINSLVAVPLTPGSWGPRELIFLFFLVPLGVEKERAFLLSFMYAGVALLWSLIGGFVYLGYVWRGSGVTRVELESAEEL